jgi:hypothetical protein
LRNNFLNFFSRFVAQNSEFNSRFVPQQIRFNSLFTLYQTAYNSRFTSQFFRFLFAFVFLKIEINSILKSFRITFRFSLSEVAQPTHLPTTRVIRHCGVIKIKRVRFTSLCHTCARRSFLVPPHTAARVQVTLHNVQRSHSPTAARSQLAGYLVSLRRKKNKGKSTSRKYKGNAYRAGARVATIGKHCLTRLKPIRKVEALTRYARKRRPAPYRTPSPISERLACEGWRTMRPILEAIPSFKCSFGFVLGWCTF